MATPAPNTADQVTVGHGRATHVAAGTVRLEFPIRLGDEATHTLWFEVPEWAAPDPATSDAAALAALLPAMRTGRDLVVEGRLSGTLLTNLRELTAVMTMWFPDFSRISIEAAHTDDDRAESHDPSVGLFFSGGVDSFHSLRTAPLQIHHLVHVDGLDSTSRDTDLHARIDEMLTDVARRTSVGLIRVRTNVRGLLDPFALWTLHAHTIALGSVGHALAGGLDTVFISADRTYGNLRPYGVHPITSPLFGSHRLATPSHGWGTTRVDKVAAIADWDVAMDHLRVCWRNPEGAYNCGTCEKCIRTLVALELVGASGRCTTLGDLPDLETIATTELTGSTVDYAVPSLRLAEQDDRHRALASALRRTIEATQQRHALERLEADWPIAAHGDVSDFVGRHRESLYRALSAYEGRWLVRQVAASLPRRVTARLRRTFRR